MRLRTEKHTLHQADVGAHLHVLRAALQIMNRFGLNVGSDICRAFYSLLNARRRKMFMRDSLHVLEPYREKLMASPRTADIFSPNPDLDDFFRIVTTESSVGPKIRLLLMEQLRHAIETAERRESKRLSRFSRKLDEIRRTFRLSEIETEIIALTALHEISPAIECILDSIRPASRGLHNIYRYQYLIDASRPVFMKAVSTDGALRRLNFFDRDGDVRSEVVEYLTGSRKLTLSTWYYQHFDGPALPLEKLTISHRDVETIRTLLANRKQGRGINILLAGPPGTGKTETVHALARELGLSLYVVAMRPGRSEDSDDSVRVTDGFRIRGLVACRNSRGAQPDTAILVDEADTLLGAGGGGMFRALFGASGSSVGKAMMNDALDAAICTQFWVANDLGAIDPSTRRRFDFAIRYERATPKDRLSIWETAARKHGVARLLRPDDLERFARERPVSAGGIDAALRNAASLPRKNLNRAEFVAYIDRLLESQLLFTEEEGKTETVLADVGEPVGIEQMNIQPADDLNQILTVASRWREAPTKRALTILLQGPPGTGKTHFARRLSSLLGMPLHAKTASEILSPYVGMTEKTIRAVFRQAERESAVLFLDEIDSLLSSRESAVRSWEVTQVNELLSALESFKGVFVAATNYGTRLDQASMRRFNFHLEFGALTPASAAAFYRRLLAGFAGGDPPPATLDRLSRLPGLVPSDFANMHKRLTLVPGMTATHDELLAGLAKLCAARTSNRHPAIGFTRNPL